MKRIHIKRGDVFLVALDGTKGSEIEKTRPGVIIQCKEGNDNAPTTIIIPITKRVLRNQPTQILITDELIESGCHRLEGLILAEQIRTVDKCRLGTYIGSLNQKGLDLIDQAILVAMGIKKEA